MSATSPTSMRIRRALTSDGISPGDATAFSTYRPWVPGVRLSMGELNGQDPRRCWKGRDVKRGTCSADGSLQQGVRDTLQLLRAGVADGDLADARGARDADRVAEALPKPVDDVVECRVGWERLRGLGALGPALRLGRLVVVHPPLSVADRQAPAQHHLQPLLLCRRRRKPDEGPGVAGADGPGCRGRDDGRTGGEEAEGLGHRHPVLAQSAGGLLVGEAELVDQPPDALRLLYGVEVLPLEVLDQAEEQAVLGVRLVPHDRRDALDAGQPGCPPASLAGDQLIPVRKAAHQDRLQDAVL